MHNYLRVVAAWGCNISDCVLMEHGAIQLLFITSLMSDVIRSLWCCCSI